MNCGRCGADVMPDDPHRCKGLEKKCFDGSHTWVGGNCRDCSRDTPTIIDALKEIFRLQKERDEAETKGYKKAGDKVMDVINEFGKEYNALEILAEWFGR